MGDTKEAVKALLHKKQYQKILDTLGENRKGIRLLRALLYEDEKLTRWRAVTMFGWLAATRPKLIKKEVERLLWSLNDEAGYIGRGAPETLGEIGRNDYPLAENALKIVAEYLKDPETCRPPNRNTDVVVGVLWGIGRAGNLHEEVARDIAPMVETFLEDPEPGIRGHAAWCLGQIGETKAKEKLSLLQDDKEELIIYEDEELQKKTVAKTATEALALL
jgi:HEAT repeat protein